MWGGGCTWSYCLGNFAVVRFHSARDERQTGGERAGKVNERTMGITARAAPRFLKVPLTCTLPLGCDTAFSTCISVMGRQC